jgi:hypothetical protein
MIINDLISNKWLASMKTLYRDIKLLVALSGLCVYACLGCGEDLTSTEEASVEPGPDESTVMSTEMYWVDLTSGSEWRIADPTEDPYMTMRAERELCTITDFGEEYGGLEVSTVYCDYATLVQPIDEEINPGDMIEVIIWHSPLVSEIPAQGEISLSLSGELLWSQHLEIPGAAQSWNIAFESSFSAPRGELLTFHVHNHGANAYTLLSVRRGRPLE